MSCPYDVLEGYLGFDQVAVGAEVISARFIFGLSQGSQHNDFNILKLFGVTQDVQHFKAADARHHNVRDDQLWFFFFGDYQGFFTVHGGDNGVTFGL